jgi:hypothetical protein
MLEELVPIQTRARELSAKPTRIVDALASGTAKCSAMAKETMRFVREKMGIT